MSATVDGPIAVRQQRFNIDYAVSDDSLPLAAVHLWYTLDRGQTWLGRRPDPDRHSPITFEAPQEGLFGFYIVATNESGASSAAPVSGTAPHLWVFVDFTPPIVQLHDAKATTHLGQPTLQIQWTAIDHHFGDRPIEISYRSPSNENWKNVTEAPLANTGRFDWTVPDGLTGSVALRVTAEDLGGNRVNSATKIVTIPSMTPTASTKQVIPTGSSPIDDRLASFLPSESLNRAQKLFDEAMQYKRDGDRIRSIARLRDVVRIRPDWPDAFVEMGDALAAVGDPDRALNAYELALGNNPTMRRALIGSARVNQQLKQHGAAAKALQLVLQQNPDDAESWLNLGDVAVYQGDELLARECYTRASQVDPAAKAVIMEAQKRLAVMASVSRTYRPSGR